jgi:hypothetical protein
MFDARQTVVQVLVALKSELWRDKVSLPILNAFKDDRCHQNRKERKTFDYFTDRREVLKDDSRLPCGPTLASIQPDL